MHLSARNYLNLPSSNKLSAVFMASMQQSTCYDSSPIYTYFLALLTFNTPRYPWTAYRTPRDPRSAYAEPLSLLRLNVPSPWLAPVCLPHMVNHFPTDMPGCMWPHGTHITLSLGSHSLSSQLDYILVIAFILSARQTHQCYTHCLVCHVYTSSWPYAVVHSSLWQITPYLHISTYPSSI